jgi:hypothetical protein
MDLPCMHVPLGWMTGGSILLLRTNALLSLERSRENNSVAAMAVLRCLPASFSGSLGCLRQVSRRGEPSMIGMGLLGFQKAYILCAQLDSGRRSWHVVATYAGPGDPLLCCVRGTSYQADPHPQRRPPTLALCHCHTSSASCAFQRRGIGHARRAQSNGSDNSAQRRFNGLCVMRAGNGRRRKNIYHRARALPVPAAWRRPCGKRVAITPWGRGDRTGPGVRHAGSLLKCRGERGERRPGTVARRCGKQLRR